MNVLIIDDESLARDVIRNYLADFPDYQIVGECSDGYEGLRAIRDLKPDLVFLDIQMPRIDGFEMIELLDELPQIIFSTAYDEFAVKAFEKNAIDYLLKPYSRQRFAQALAKANQSQANSIREKAIQDLASNYTREHAPHNRLMIKDGAGIVVLNTHEVIFIEADDDYVSIQSTTKRYLQQKTLSWYEGFLGPNFLRIHRSFLLNPIFLSRIEPYGKESWIAILNESKYRLPVSKTGHRIVMQHLSGKGVR